MSSKDPNIGQGQGQVSFTSAASFDLSVLADLMTRSFVGYWYPIVATPENLSQSIRVEQIDLYRSIVMELDGQPAGVAMLAFRGDRAWCARFGVLESLRGQGLSHRLTNVMIEQARLAGARELSLEVLVRNTRAIAAYQRAGLRMWRDLLLLEWRAPEMTRWLDDAGNPSELMEVDASWLLEQFGPLHAVRMPWQRDLPSLLVRGGLQGLALWYGAAPIAYALLRIDSSGTMWLVDVAAATSAEASTLLAVLQRRSRRIMCINEPEDSPLLPALSAAGFVEIDRQHEMVLTLDESGSTG